MPFFEEAEKVIKNRPVCPEGRNTPTAVLIPLFNDSSDGHIKVMLTQRALDLDRQPGDFCFPGGHSENGETSKQTALRETFEETGIYPKDVKILGHTDFIVSAFGAFVMPYIGKVKESSMRSLNLSRDEVEKAIFVPLKFFMDTTPEMYAIEMKNVFPADFPFDKIYGGKDYQWRKSIMEEYFYEYKGDVIWGITARMIKNLCEILRNTDIKFN
ncbi:MAG: CoA pyrophosphatase [Clostridia bacterium]|jgi:8-oxo-dGTP pyrophosphatase MutT (NUDIX family)|nr:CoA pyrophosphatase [Clostridia bacterium]MCI2000833.1 CoA pyrophosphatase [Clostridia bacterium]MCI2015375.1 CoA pyrophosphatase [Clostridia bacterium]